jgi:hypothetical protein
VLQAELEKLLLRFDFEIIDRHLLQKLSLVFSRKTVKALSSAKIEVIIGQGGDAAVKYDAIKARVASMIGVMETAEALCNPDSQGVQMSRCGSFILSLYLDPVHT